MARDRLTFRQRDVTAAIKAVEAAGKNVARVVVRKDGVEVITGETVVTSPEDDEAAEIARLREEAENAKV